MIYVTFNLTILIFLFIKLEHLDKSDFIL